MAWTARQRWMAYALAALATLAAIWAMPPEDEAEALLPPARPAATPRPATSAAPLPQPTPAGAAVLAERPYGGAGRDPFSASAASAQRTFATPPPPSPAAMAAARAAAAAAQAAAEAAQAPRFTFLGRWHENGETTVFLSTGGRPLAARAGQRLTPDYLVEHIGERELRLRELRSGRRSTVALVAGGTTGGSPGAPAAAQDIEEQN